MFTKGDVFFFHRIFSKVNPRPANHKSANQGTFKSPIRN
jgi:hypothetical protein